MAKSRRWWLKTQDPIDWTIKIINEFILKINTHVFCFLWTVYFAQVPSNKAIPTGRFAILRGYAITAPDRDDISNLFTRLICKRQQLQVTIDYSGAPKGKSRFKTILTHEDSVTNADDECIMAHVSKNHPAGTYPASAFYSTSYPTLEFWFFSPRNSMLFVDSR